MGFLVGLISLLLLGAFSLLYVSKTLGTKPEFVTKAVDFITKNIDTLALVGLVYGLFAILMTPVVTYGAAGILVRMLCNIVLVVLTMPYAFEKIVAKSEGKINEAIASEFRNFINWTAGQEKIMGYSGAVATVMLFAVVFE
jgi:hypothetical protein